MKDKKDIHSPIKRSKTPESKTELIKRLKEENKELADAFNEHTKKLNGELHFEKAVPKLAKKLKVSEQGLKDAYIEDKGELVAKFNKRNALSSGAGPLSMATGMFGSLTGLFAYSSLVDPEFFNAFITVLYGSVTLLLGSGVKKILKDKDKIDQDLKTNVLEYKKSAQLPPPK